MKQLFLFTLLCLTLLVLHSCSEDEENPNCGNPYTRMEQGAANYLFNDSSYWIYQNTSSLEIDSQVVFYSCRYTRPTGKPASGCEVPLTYEWNYYVEQHVYGDIDSFAFTCIAPYKFYYFSRPFTISTPTLLRMQIGDLDMNEGDNNETITFLEQYDSLVIGDSTYSNVSVFHILAVAQPVAAFPYEMDLYFAPNIGIVRKVEYNTPSGTQMWDLVRYRTIPLPDNKYP